MAEIIGENVVVGLMTVIQPKVCLVAEGEEQQTVIGEENILEDFVYIRNSQIGSQNLIEVKCYVDESVIGNGCKIGPRCRLLRCQIGDHCTIAAGITLEDAIIPANSSVFLDQTGWRTRTTENFHITAALLPALRDYYTSATSR
eukprot:scaffold1828_cov187-Ochromonas_danica.AAC.6